MSEKPAKALEALDGLNLADMPRTQKVGQEYRDLREDLLLDWLERNIDLVRAALQPPSTDLEVLDDALRTLWGKLPYPVPDEVEQAYTLLEKHLATLQPPSTDLEALIIQTAQHVVSHRDNTVDPADAFECAILAVKFLAAQGHLKTAVQTGEKK